MPLNGGLHEKPNNTCAEMCWRYEEKKFEEKYRKKLQGVATTPLVAEGLNLLICSNQNVSSLIEIIKMIRRRMYARQELHCKQCKARRRVRIHGDQTISCIELKLNNHWCQVQR